MKIALLTYHRNYNYGAILQAIATRIILEKLGHDVFYINYWPDHQSVLYKDPSLFYLCRKYIKKNIIKTLKLSYKWIYQQIRRYKYEKVISRYICPYYGDTTKDYDTLICGSDQIWRKQPITGKYNSFYFGKNDIKAKERISFASSMGRLPEEEDISIIKQLLEKFDSISVREKNLCDFINSICNKNAEVVIDPTLLLTREEWDKCFNINDAKISSNYVLVYDLGQRFKKEEINAFAVANGLTVKEIQPWLDLEEQRFHPALDTPIDFIRLIRGASVVITSSFHGMALSIVYQKTFYVNSGRNTDRFLSLIDLLQLNEQWIDPKDLNIIVPNVINYNKVLESLENLKSKSMRYLTDSLSKNRT